VAVAVLAAVAFAVMTNGRGATVTPLPKVDSTPPAAQATSVPRTAATDSARRDSLARDSATKALASKDSIAKDSVAKDSAARALAASAKATRDSVARDSAAKALAARNSAARIARDSARTPRIRPESIAVQCARLLERVSLGERLTDAERRVLRQQCPK
jgi:hypothetical protein